MSRPETPVLDVRGLVKHYATSGGAWLGRRQITAVDGVDLTVAPGETLGLVGESGCGKSTLGRCVLRLEEPNAGQVRVLGEDLLAMDRGTLRRFRQKAQMIFQDPRGSLNPKMRVRDIVTEGLLIHGLVDKSAIASQAAELLERVGLDASAGERYPHQFSGGQRQRIGIARALAVNPTLIIADEPTSALDVSIQAQIVNLLLDLQRDLGLTYLFITHDLRLVRFFADRIAVMFRGRIVESADTLSLFDTAQHPYTQTLLAATPVAHPSVRSSKVTVTASADAQLHVPAGCPYQHRCPIVSARCREEVPQLRQVGATQVACHNPLAPAQEAKK